MDADPTDGWLPVEYTSHASVAKEDVYGSLFFFLRELLLKFCHRLQGKNIFFELYNLEVGDIADILLDHGKTFDRIEVCSPVKSIKPTIML